jgi:hypothetical protein
LDPCSTIVTTCWREQGSGQGCSERIKQTIGIRGLNKKGPQTSGCLNRRSTIGII